MKDTKKGMVSPKLPRHLKISLLKIADNDLNDQIFETITNYLSNKYGYCVDCVSVEKDNFEIVVDWDTTE